MIEFDSEDIIFKPFSKLTSTLRMQQILTDDFVAKMTGFPYGENYYQLVPSIMKYIDDNNLIIEVHLADREKRITKLVGFVGFKSPNSDYLRTIIKRGVFGRNPETIKKLAEHTTQISYFLDANYHGMGIGTQMVRKAIDRRFASTKNPCACIVATYGIFHDHDFSGPNVRSKNLLEHLGFEHLKIFRNICPYSGEQVDVSCNYLLNPSLQNQNEKTSTSKDESRDELER